MPLSSLGVWMAAVLVVARYFSTPIARRLERHHMRLVSFSAGLFIAYFFLALLPVVFRAPASIQRDLFAAMLLGLATIHLVEKYVYQHVTNRKELLKELGELHVLGSFADSFIIGFAIVVVLDAGLRPGEVYFILIPFLLHTLAASLSTAHIHAHFKLGFLGNALLSSGPLAGAVAASYLQWTPSYFYLTFAFLLGVILYSVLRGILPQKKKGEPLFFFLGLVIAWFALWIVH